MDLKTAELKCFRRQRRGRGSRVSAMPTVFRPVEIDGMLLVDGGVLCRVPVKKSKMSADVVVAVDVQGKLKNSTRCRTCFRS
ncbi:MAG: hypothetical protein ACLRTQ_09960 [Candidatus Borkfalkia sp.]